MKKILVVIISAIFLSGCNRLDNHQPLSSHHLLFSKADKISQSFVSNRDDLNTVYICLRNTTRSEIPLRFLLSDETGLVIRSLDFTGGNIDNFDCTRFQFEKISSSKGKSYTASIETNLSPDLDATDEELLRYGLYIEAHGGGDYLAGFASVDGAEVPYDLHFKTLYTQPLPEILKESITQFLARLTKDPVFFLLFIALIVTFVYKLKKAK